MEDKRIIQTARLDSFQKLLSTAGSIAARNAKSAGLPITYIADNRIIKEYSDGRIEVLGSVVSGPVISGGVITIPDGR